MVNRDVSVVTETITTEDVLRMYRRMRLIRRFEERTSELYRDTEVPGFVHLSIGQEAAAVGACWSLHDSDVITSTHRGHGHCLAKGLDPYPMFAELMGRDTGTCHGRGGSMHIADPELGVYGANGIVAAGLPIAVGAATAAQLRDDGSVVVAFFGDGAVAQGMFHESVNLAALWKLPIIFVCENNHYAEFSRAENQHPAPLSARAIGYGINHTHVNGNDVVAVAELMIRLTAEVRTGGGPALVEADTNRWRGHYEGDGQSYRGKSELEYAKLSDPLLITCDQLADRGVEIAQIDLIDNEVEQQISQAIQAARAAPYPSPESLFNYVYAPRVQVTEPTWDGVGAEFKLMNAVREAIEYELEHDTSVFLAGIDVGDGGNVFGLFRGLAEAYPGRVRDTPISESAIIGTAVGAAMAGMRPVVEIMYMDFIGVCLDQLLNQAAKLQFMTGGRATMPLVVRTQFGAGRSSGSQHSQSLEALLAHIPGLTVVMPSNPADAYGLLRAAIRDPNPVIFVENRLQYGMKGPRPPVDYLIPLGKAKVVRAGEHVTLVTYSRFVQESLAASEILESEGIEVEVIDLRTVAPFDRETILTSLSKTHRIVIAHEAVQDFGVGAEIAAMAANEGFWYLDAPVTRVASPFTPTPYSPALEKLWLPDRHTIVEAVRKIVAV